MIQDTNYEKYESAEFVGYYKNQVDLQPSEAYLFDRYIDRDAEILDIGVGAGRTTVSLSAQVRRYVGIDYSKAMVDWCRAQFPDLDFAQCDATDLSRYPDHAFDVVLFSFNGIDVIRTDAARRRCLQEIARVLRPRGVFIFSSHNARALAHWPSLQGASLHQIPYRAARAIYRSLGVTYRALRHGTYFAGRGYICDRIDRGIYNYFSTPEVMAEELRDAGLELLEWVSGPRLGLSSLTAPWYYYACRKAGGV